MKVTVLSTFDRQGGAAEAAFRHVEALRLAGVEVRMLVRTAREDVPWIAETGTGFIHQKKIQFLEWTERFRFIRHAARREDWFSFSIADLGQRVTEHPWIREADILNPHWVQKGFLSIAELGLLSNLGKPMIWHLQDMWAFTGGCHYAGSCTHFTQSCGHCPYLKQPGTKDLSAAILSQKRSLWGDAPFQVSTSSKWLQQEALKSSLFQDKEVLHLPMGVNTDRYLPGDPTVARQRLGLPEDGLVFLFVAMNVQDRRKGFHLLATALARLAERVPSEIKSRITLAVLGKFDPEQRASLPFRVHPLGFRSDLQDILDAYRAANLFILPSLEDNLPNTVLEAMSCETPVVAFDSGGVPEMIEHQQNGLLAASGDADALSKALYTFVRLEAAVQQDWGQQARKSMIRQYGYPVVAAKHIAHYEKQL
ncbi:MAG: glycosyltransferase [Saprospiraceae bacterium]|nr:glycosyltransferase [Saprospiraceae bacterium]